jgi:hypothetical protein
MFSSADLKRLILGSRPERLSTNPQELQEHGCCSMMKLSSPLTPQQLQQLVVTLRRIR